MSEKKKVKGLFNYGDEIDQIILLKEAFLGLFDPQLVAWEKQVDPNDSTNQKMQRRLTNTRFNLLDAVNDLTKVIQADLSKEEEKS
jgi:hypothetical protein